MHQRHVWCLPCTEAPCRAPGSERTPCGAARVRGYTHGGLTCPHPRVDLPRPHPRARVSPRRTRMHDARVGPSSPGQRTPRDDALPLGQLVREARERAGLSMRVLAEAAGLHPSYLSRVERDLAWPSAAALRDLLEAAGMRFEVAVVPPTIMGCPVPEKGRDARPCGGARPVGSAHRPAARAGRRLWRVTSHTSGASAETTKHGFETLAIHAGQEPDPLTGAVVPPIYQTSTYKQDGVGGLRGGYEYSRSGEPDPDRARGVPGRARGRRARAGVRLRAGRRGHAAAGASAGPATTWSSRTTRTAAPTGCSPRSLQRWGLDHTPAALADLDAVRAAIQPGRTKVVWVETPTNPLLGIADIAALADVAHDGGALLVVDNTFATPYLQQPLGARRRRRRALDHEVPRRPLRRRRRRARRPGRRRGWASELAFHQNAMGAVAGPFDAWLVLRGLKTLGGADGPALRQRRARRRSCSTAHPRVSQVLYPGLPEHPGHEVAAAADARLRRHGVASGCAVASRRRSASASGPRCSPSASRSAASSR